MKSLFFFALSGFFAAWFNSSSQAGSWGYWRGPDSSGAAPEGAAPPVEWSEDKNVKWKVAIPGEGSGTAVVWGEKVFVQSAVKAGSDSAGVNVLPGSNLLGQAAEEPRRRRPGGKGFGKGKGGFGGGGAVAKHRFVLICLDRKTGEVIWEKTAVEELPHEGHHQTHAFGSHSPVTNGEVVIGFFGSRGVFCYDMEGELQWKRDLGEMTMRATFGEGNSAAIYGSTVIVPWFHEGPSALYALDVKSGETIWKAETDEPTNWGSPLVLELDGAAQVVVTGENKVRAYDLGSGKELWKSGGQTSRPVASPVTDGENVYVGSGFRGNYFAAIQLGGSGDLTGSDSILWEVDRNTPDIASPLLSEGRLYFLSAKSAIVTCVDAKSGKVHWGPERIPGLGDVYSSPVAANGNVYLVGREGKTVVFKDAETFEVVATNELDDPIDGSPVVVGKEMFLRGKHYLYCIGEG